MPKGRKQVDDDEMELNFNDGHTESEDPTEHFTVCMSINNSNNFVVDEDAYELLGHVIEEAGAELFHTAKLFALNNKRVTPNSADFRYNFFFPHKINSISSEMLSQNIFHNFVTTKTMRKL